MSLIKLRNSIRVLLVLSFCLNIMLSMYNFYRSATEICNRGSFHNKEKKAVIRCPSNHSLVNVRDFDNIDTVREKEKSPRHYHPQTRCQKDEEAFETSRSFRYCSIQMDEISLSLKRCR